MNVNVNVKKKKPGRKRRLAGWTLITLGLLVAGVWVVSGRGECRIAGMTTVPEAPGIMSSGGFTVRGITIGAGLVSFDVYHTSVFLKYEDGVRFGRYSTFTLFPLVPAATTGEQVHWSAGVMKSSTFKQFNNPCKYVAVTFWPIPLLLWAAGVSVLRSGILARRRAMTGCCGKCGYSLAGLAVGSACPECGKGAGTK